MTRHSHEDAINERTFENLVDAAETLDDPYRTEGKFILYACGRLGLRGGELAHVREGWINWDRSLIEIPTHDPCDKGRDGGPCGYCHKRARSKIEFEPSLSYDEALAQRWEPKTSNSARPVPFDFNEEIAQAVEDFFWSYDRYDHSRVSVNRRVSRVCKAAGLPESTTYPHALRATAATFHAYRGLSPVALQALMGWNDLVTAQKYIRLTGEATAQALRDAHS